MVRRDNKIFAMMLTDTLRYCLLSIMFALSSANEEMVVKEPQKPIATRRVF